MTVLRWGIVSAGKISNDFCAALDTLPFDEHKVVAVAASQIGHAQKFASTYKIEHAFGSYQELAEFKDIDVAYIGALNPQHYELSLLMLQNGKHVLCEKPLCMNRDQAHKLIQYAESKKLFLMEAVWSRFFPAYQYVRKQINSGVLGEIKEVEVNFGFLLQNVNRLQKKDLGGGICLDLGIYVIQLAQWAFQEPPVNIKFSGELNTEGVDVYFAGELTYTGERKAKITCSGRRLLDNTATIKGTKGQITLIDFWSPTKLIDIDGKEKEWVLPKGRFSTNFPNSEGLRYEAEAVRKSILAGELQNENVNHNESLLFAQIEDEIRKQLGVEFPEDTI